MPARRSWRVLWVTLIPVLVFPLYGISCNPRSCPPAPDPCQRNVYSVGTGECVLTDIGGAICEYEEGVTGICSDGQCLPSECAGVASYGICDEPLGGGLVGACVEDLCTLAAPEDECVRVGVGRINCCSQQGCAVASGAYCNDPLDGVSCDPTGVEPAGQPGQDGICANGTCIAQTGLCAGLACPTSVTDPCARDYCNTENGQCEEWILQTFPACVVAGAEGICQGGTCTPIGGGECGGVPCATSNPCKVAACRFPCTYTVPGCTPDDYLNETPICEFDDVPDGAPCQGEPGQCFNGTCYPVFLGCNDDDDCDYDNDECTVNECDPFGNLCDTSGVQVLPDDTPCAEDQYGVFQGLCRNSVCLPNLCIGRDCSDGDLCTQDICIPPYGICSNPTAPNGTSCENNGECFNGTCQPVFVPCTNDNDCDDGRSCTVDDCDPFGGICSNTTLPTGAPCIGEEGQCFNGTCQPVFGGF